jgi:hypothetical protein
MRASVVPIGSFALAVWLAAGTALAQPAPDAAAAPIGPAEAAARLDKLLETLAALDKEAKALRAGLATPGTGQPPAPPAAARASDPPASDPPAPAPSAPAPAAPVPAATQPAGAEPVPPAPPAAPAASPPAAPPIPATTGPRDQLGAHTSDFDIKTPPAAAASRDKAQLLAYNFVKNAGNKGPEYLEADYFKKNIVKRQPLPDGESQPIQSLGNAGPLVPAVIVATAMQEVEAAERDDAKLLTAWLAKQTQILAEMNRGAPESILYDDEARLTWQLFLDEWVKAAVAKGNFRAALQSAPYEFLRDMLEIVAGQTVAAQAGPAAARAAAGTTSLSTAGGYFPFHERRMNHIYRHHERRMAKVERIRARR